MTDPVALVATVIEQAGGADLLPEEQLLLAVRAERVAALERLVVKLAGAQSESAVLFLTPAEATEYDLLTTAAAAHRAEVLAGIAS